MHNGGGSAITLNAKSTNATDGTIIQALNGSEIIIDGLVNATADASKGANEVIKAVGATVEVAGGEIKTANGAEYAIRINGTSETNGIVNINVKKDAEGVVTSADNNKVVLVGNVVADTNLSPDFFNLKELFFINEV